MSIDILDQLGAAAAPLLAARDEIQTLRQQVAAAASEAAELVRALAEVRAEFTALAADKGGTAPALPRQRKYLGTAYNTDGEAMTRTDRELDAHGKHCYAAGIAEAQRQTRAAKSKRPAGDYSESRRREDDLWAARRRGDRAEVQRLERGSKP